jgi:hypothetical protein
VLLEPKQGGLRSLSPANSLIWTGRVGWGSRRVHLNATFMFGLSIWLGTGCQRESKPEPQKQPQSTDQPPTDVQPQPPVSAVPAAIVSLDGGTQLQQESIPAGTAKVCAKSLQTWIYSEPKQNAGRLGYLRLGACVAVDPQPIRNASCSRGWARLLSRGYVCLDASSTTDLSDPIVGAMRNLGPVLDRKLPYIYGTVRRPGPVYRKIPSREDLLTAEPDLPKRFERWLNADGEFGAGFAQQVWLPSGATVPDPKQAWLNKISDPIPEFLQSGRFAPRITGDAAPSSSSAVLGAMATRVGYSLLQTFLFEGRRYGVSAKFEVVPTDRLRPIQGSDFHGFRIPEDIDFPFAIVRQPGAMLMSYDSGSKKTTPKQRAPYRGAIKLTGKQAFFRGKLYYETVDNLWLSDRDASRLDPVRKMPAWGTNGEKWIDINVTKQTLALYEGKKAVYATLVSTGEAGLSDPANSTATKRGIYRIHTKHLSVTMDSDEVGEEFELRDVPYVQYFESNYALHGAYWHDRFGIPKSHGCINLAPEDARRIFFWTEPNVPAGWHGALLPLKGTLLFVHP